MQLQINFPHCGTNKESIEIESNLPQGASPTLGTAGTNSAYQLTTAMWYHFDP